MTCLRVMNHAEPAARAAMCGNIKEALRLTAAGSSNREYSIQQRAVLGQLHGRLLIAQGRDEEAEEVFHQQLHIYCLLPKITARCLACLDRGVLELSQKRVGRAASQFNLAADDSMAPDELRIEALVGLATALQILGDVRRVQGTLDFALRLATPLELDLRINVLTAVRLDLKAQDFFRPTSIGATLVSSKVALYNDICCTRDKLSMLPVLQNRLDFLATLLHVPQHEDSFVNGIRGTLNLLRKAQLSACEDASRIDALLACVGLNKTDLSLELVGNIEVDERHLERHRFGLELMLCFSHIHATRGRHIEALNLQKQHTNEALHRMRRELPLLPYSRFLEKDVATTTADASELSLPIRYRKGYRFILERLGDRDLSIRQVAAHIDVTERALQMAFRMHLGMSPAEVIRRRRMEHIRSELLQCDSDSTMLDVASRWGISSRSTFTQNYRLQFGEAPSSTLRGGSRESLSGLTTDASSHAMR
jgi:AraC-like DNA-binding protein